MVSRYCGYLFNHFRDGGGGGVGGGNGAHLIGRNGDIPMNRTVFTGLSF